MQVNEVIKELEKGIADFSASPEYTEFGIIQSVSDGIALVSGMANCQASEMVTFENGATGLALNLDTDTVGVVVLDQATSIRQGETVKRTGKILSIPVGTEFIGRVVNPLMEPVDGMGSIKAETEYSIERLAPGVMSREPVNQPLQTGVLAIDALVPIGRGQRELIIGDRQTGKTTVALDSILNQKGKNVKCVYVAIGQKESKVMRIVETLRQGGAMDYTTVVVAGASDNPAQLYLAPYAGVTLAEYLMDQGDDVLIVYDDLSKQAVAYREMSLLLRRPPGREAYPGDVFYIHSRLLERACRRNKEHGGGSITALPIIETQGGDVSAYIPTNVISITDGQIFLESNLFYKGVRPAINVGLSVSRVGGSAQTKAMKKNAGPMKNAMAQYRELESFAQFGSDLDAETKASLERGKRVVEVMKQAQFSPLPVALQVASIFAVNQGFMDEVEVSSIKSFQLGLMEFLRTAHPDLLTSLESGWGDDQEQDLRQACEYYSREFKAQV